MNELGYWIGFVLGLVLIALSLYAAFFIYVVYNYGQNIYRIFETKPLLFAERGKPLDEGEAVTLAPAEGRSVAATYLPHQSAAGRLGVLLFCHEYGSTRWSFQPYLGHLRAAGYDIFTFDFCNHGDSDTIDGYEHRQWVTVNEIADVRAALRYLASRPDAPDSGVGVFGISRGGGAGIAGAAAEPNVGAVATDGAFPTHGMVTAYEMKWVEIYVKLGRFYQLLPRYFYSVLTNYVVFRESQRHGVWYPRLETSLNRLRRPILMIYGGRDTYIKPPIAEYFYREARQPKRLWFVDGAKHNAALTVAGDDYRQALLDFFRRHLGEEPDASSCPNAPEPSESVA